MASISIQKNGAPLPSLRCDATTFAHSSLVTPDLTTGAEGVWPTREEFEENLRKVLLIAPFTRHRCCFGCIALDDAVLLICVFQLIQLVVLSLLGTQLAMSDGYLFYTTILEGHGSTIALITGTFVLFSVLVISVTLYAWAKQKPRLYLLHIVWQICLVCIMIGTIRLVFKNIKSSDQTDPKEYQILMPSAVVIIFFFVVGALIQIWWIAVMVDAYFNQYTTAEHLGRTIAIVVPGLLRYPRPGDQFADEMSIEMPPNYDM